MAEKKTAAKKVDEQAKAKKSTAKPALNAAKVETRKTKHFRGG